MALHLRALTEEEAQTIKKWSSLRKGEARLVERAKIVRLASEGRKWLKRFAEQGCAGLEDAPRSGAPSRYTPEVARPLDRDGTHSPSRPGTAL